jgi:hypothetical protein
MRQAIETTTHTAASTSPTSLGRVPGAGPRRHQHPLYYLDLTISHIGLAGHASCCPWINALSLVGPSARNVRPRQRAQVQGRLAVAQVGGEGGAAERAPADVHGGVGVAVYKWRAVWLAGEREFVTGNDLPCIVAHRCIIEASIGKRIVQTIEEQHSSGHRSKHRAA